MAARPAPRLGAAAGVDPARLKADGLLDAEQITQLWQQHQSGSFDRSYYLWNVIVFQAWQESLSRG